MEAKELRIGNLLNFGYDNEHLKPTKVTHLMIYNQSGKDEVDGLYQPIKLTEEWLKKFGFENDSKSGNVRLSLDDFYNLEAMRIGEEYSMFHEKKPDEQYAHSIRRIKHVHQLQNLYFALTGKELTIK